jgi:hypothetical protein
MRLRPQFQLRFRDEDQFVAFQKQAAQADISMNEWLLQKIEAGPLVTLKTPAGRILEVMPEKVARRVGAGCVPVPEEASAPVAMCAYTEYDTDTGETYRCGRPVHGVKVKHTRGVKL